MCIDEGATKTPAVRRKTCDFEKPKFSFVTVRTLPPGMIVGATQITLCAREIGG